MRNPYKKFQNSSIHGSKVMLCIKKAWRTDGWMDEQPRSNMPLQLLWGWEHNQQLVKEIVHTQTFYCINKAHFLSIYNVVTLKITSRSSKSNHCFPPSWWCICASLVKFHPLVKEIMCTRTFYCINKALFFLSIYSVVTLKIRSRSTKSNHFFAPFLWCICASLVKFQPLFKEILCTQSFYFINKVPFEHL